MAQAKNGDKVLVDYTGKLDDGTVFDTSLRGEEGCGPLEFVIGEGSVIPGFDAAVLGMKIGDSKEVRIPADQAYGPRMDELVAVIGRADFPDNIKPEIGHQLEVTQNDGQTFVVTVTDLNDESVTLDANHPLAGQALTFEITLKEIV